MKNKGAIWCYISAVISYIAGIAYSCTLIFLPIAIYCFIFGNRYLKIAKITDAELYVVRGLLNSSAIFISIVAFPIGLVSIIPALLAGSNNAKVSDNIPNNSTVEGESQTVKANDVEVSEIIEETDKDNSLTQEDLEKLEKLESFKKQGLLSREEFEEAKNQIYKKK